MVPAARSPKANLQKIKQVNVLTDRVKRRRNECLATPVKVSTERARLVTQSWRETEDQPLEIRRARLFQKLLEGISIVIRDGELIVGSQSKLVRSASSFVDYNPYIALQEIEKSTLSEEDSRILQETANYWKEKAAVPKQFEALRKVFGAWVEDAAEARVTARYNTPPCARDVDYEKVLHKGLKSVIEEAKHELARLDRLDAEELHKYHFLEAVIIALEAAVTYAGRYAMLARTMATREKDAVRKAELNRIAVTCERVPENGARNFYEAVQSFWFLLLTLNLETAWHTESLGRFDQYLYPFYEKDISEGTLTHQDAAEILGCLWVKFAEMAAHKDRQVNEILPGNQLMNIAIAGVTKDGLDATNELSYLILEVVGQMKANQPRITLRYHDGLPKEFLVKALETNVATGGATPQYINDKAAIFQMVELGIPVEDARDWASQACSFVHIPHRGCAYGRHAHLHLAKILELVLNNGVDAHRTGKRLLPPTGDPRSFSSYEELDEAFRQQFNYVLKRVARATRLVGAVCAENYAMPFNSALMDDCIKNGKDVLQGGQRYPQLMLGSCDRGHVNAANSLFVLKKLVFEEKKITMAELLKALAVDFKGKEQLHKMLLSAPKWGNDNDEVDDIMIDLWSWTAKAIRAETNLWNKPLTIGRHGADYHIWAGKTVGALPDGRKAYTPLADGSVSPMAGTDTSGPQAVVNSASKLDLSGHVAATFNLSIPAALMGSASGRKTLLSLIKSYFDRGGLHVQFILVD